jgi:Alkylmercury lyase
MPEATLAVRRAAFRQLLSGRPALIETVADEAGLSTDAASEAVDLVVSVGMAEVEDGTIVGMDGLTTRRTSHALVLDGVEVWTWCAYDIVGIAAALVAEAVGSTQCGACGRPIEVLIREGQPEGSSVVGWLPTNLARTSWRSSVRARCCSAHGRTSTSGGRGETQPLAQPWTSRPSPIAAGASGISSFREASGFAQRRSQLIRSRRARQPVRCRVDATRQPEALLDSAERSRPSMRIVGEPTNRSRSASSEVTTSSRSGSTSIRPSSRSTWRSRSYAMRQCGQPSKYRSVTRAGRAAASSMLRSLGCGGTAGRPSGTGSDPASCTNSRDSSCT